MMSAEALATALRGPHDATGRAYRELVETLITEAEVDGVQERAWQRQRQSQLRIAELEAREDVRAGRGALADASPEQSEEGERSFKRSPDDGAGQAPRTTSDASCEEEADPPPAQEPGGKIRALEAELALSIERERETVRKLRECGPLLSADLREPEFGTPSKLVRSNREDNRTETDTSDWDTDSESNSQDCTPTRRSAREAAKIRRDESSFSRNGALENDRTEESGAVSNGGLPMTYETIAEPQNEGVGGFSEALELEEEATLTEGSRPHSPGGWEEVAQVKAEQLEEAKLLLTAVMEGERAALETVARLELELQASREEKLEVERKGAEAAAIASAQIEALSAIVEESVRRLREKDGVNGDRWDEGWGASSENKRGAGEKAGVDSAGFRTGEESVQLGEDAVRTGKEGARLSKGGGRNGKEDVQMSKDGVRSIGRGVRDGEVSVRREERGVRTTGDGARTSSETDTADLLEAEGQDSESSGTSETDSRSGTDGSHLSRHPSEATPQRRGKRALSLAPSSDAEDDAGPSDHTDGSERERSDTDESGTRRRVSTVEELRVREAEYRAQCEELQQQVRRALEQVEVLRKQQSGREARAAAAYEGRLSAYVKQMVGVQRENEELRAGQPAHQKERKRLQEQLDAEHEKRREEFHAAEARVNLLSEALRELSERVLERTSELQRTCRRTLRASDDDSQDDVSRARLSREGKGLGKVKQKSLDEVLKSCRAVMRAFEREADEIGEAMERTAEMGRELQERTAEMGRRLEERTAEMSRQLEERGAQLDRLVAERDQALEKIGSLLAERRELEGVKEEKDEALARERVLLVEVKALEGVRVEKAEAVEEARGLRAQVVELERKKVEYEEEVADLESRLRQQESGLEQYKAEIQEELAGLAEHMHVAAAERAREDAEHRNRTEESARTLRTREETIGRLENEVQMREESIGRLENGVRTWEDMIRRLESDVRTREEMLGRLEGEVRTLRTQDETIGRLENGNRKRDEAIGRLENEVRELKQQLWNERELSESVRQQLRASEKSEVPPGRGGEESKKRGEAAERSARPSQLRKEARQPGAKAAAGSGDCPNCGEAGPDMMRKMRAENDELWGEKRRLEAQVKAREEEAERAMAALRREEAGVERLNGKVLALIDEKETFAQGRNEDERKRFDQMQGGESLVQRLKVVLKEQEAKVAELEGNVKKLLYEKDALELELARSAAGMEAIEKQRDFLLRAKEKQVVMLTQKVERLELAAGGKSEAGWDANQKEKLIAEVQDILEQYSMAGEGSVRWEKSTEREVEGAGEEMFESEGTVAASDGSERSLERSEEQTDGPLRVNGRSRYDGPEASGKDQASEQRRGLGETENERRSEESGLKADTTERAQFGREERVRTGVQAAPSEIERQMAGVQRTSEEEIATLREKVRLLEGRQGPLREERRVSVEHGTRTGATVGESAGGMAGAWKVGLVGHAAGITDPAADQSARLSPGERQNSDLGQPKVWSDKRPTGEEGTPSKQGLLGAIPATQAAERASDGEAKLFEDNASLRLKVAELRESNRELQLRVKVLEEDRSKLLDKIATSQGPVFSADTGSQIGAQAAEIAALQAQLAEAAARLTEQRGRYKHLKGKYLRQLARQQAMHEYMVQVLVVPVLRTFGGNPANHLGGQLQGGESPANLSPRSGVAPSVGRPRTSVDDANLPSGAPSATASRSGADSRGGTWPEPWGDLGPGQRQGMVAQNSQKRSVGAKEQAVPSGRSLLRLSIREATQGSERLSDSKQRSRGGDPGQGQHDGRKNEGGLGEALHEVPERGPSSTWGPPDADTRFSKPARNAPGSSREGPLNESSQRAFPANVYKGGRNESRPPSPYGSRASSRRPSRTDSVATYGGVPSGRQSRADSAPMHSRFSSRRSSQADSAATLSGIPVGLRVLMDGRPLPGFPAKVEDLGGYFAEARAQSDGVNSSAKLPLRRASSPYVYRKAERRASRASSAPPMRPAYTRSAKVWV